MLHRTPHKAQGEQGAALVEFALILPVLLILVMGILNFGYVFGQQLSLNQAAREGARLAVVSSTANPDDIDGFVRDATGGLIPDPDNAVTGVKVTSDAQEQTNNPLNFGDFLGSEVQTCALAYTDFGGQLKVTAEYQSKWLVPTFIPLTAPKLTAVSVFRCEEV